MTSLNNEFLDTADGAHSSVGRSEPTDAAVIACSLQNPDAFSELFERYFDQIYTYLARRIGRTLADDLAAETFLVAFDKRARYKSKVPCAAPWLFGIASNLVSRHRRAEERRYRAMSRAEQLSPTECHGNENEINSLLEANSERKYLASALSQLAERDRQVLLLVAWAELSCEDAARALGIPAGTARSRLHRARRLLRAELRTTSK
jgi:RNA polymerase sigma factor (sigma-70 family)